MKNFRNDFGDYWNPQKMEIWRMICLFIWGMMFSFHVFSVGNPKFFTIPLKNTHFFKKKLRPNKKKSWKKVGTLISLVRLQYFTNLDFLEIRGPISLPKSYLLGVKNSCEVVQKPPTPRHSFFFGRFPWAESASLVSWPQLAHFAPKDIRGGAINKKALPTKTSKKKHVQNPSFFGILWDV